jgi:hypothetical protein
MTTESQGGVSGTHYERECRARGVDPENGRVRDPRHEDLRIAPGPTQEPVAYRWRYLPDDGSPASEWRVNEGRPVVLDPRSTLRMEVVPLFASPPAARADTGSPGLTQHSDTEPVAQEREPER